MKKFALIALAALSFGAQAAVPAEGVFTCFTSVTVFEDGKGTRVEDTFFGLELHRAAFIKRWDSETQIRRFSEQNGTVKFIEEGKVLQLFEEKGRVLIEYSENNKKYSGFCRRLA